MILEAIAKPVRIRITSGGVEHSSVESLKKNFVLSDLIELIQDGRLSRWLQQQGHKPIPDDLSQMAKANPKSETFEKEIYQFFFHDDAKRILREKAERKAREEAERKAKEEAERKAKEEAKRKAKEEAERKAKEEAERKAKEEAERKAKEEAERKAKEEAERKAKELLKMGKFSVAKDKQVVFRLDDYSFHNWKQAKSLEKEGWRLLSRQEWNYLLQERNNAEDLREITNDSDYIKLIPDDGNKILSVYLEKKGYINPELKNLQYKSGYYAFLWACSEGKNGCAFCVQIGEKTININERNKNLLLNVLLAKDI